MTVLLKYRGREITATEARSIQELIASHPQASRWRLSKLLCEAWDLRQANGELRDMLCRGLMLALHRAGHIELPAPRRKTINNAIGGKKRQPAAVDSTPLSVSLSELLPLEIRQVRRTADEPLYDALIAEHHYLGYTRPVGEHLKFIVYTRGRPVACLAWGSVPRHLGPRDRFIGWSPAARRCNLHLLAINLRFLVLPWVQVPHLASHLLGRMAKVLSAEWERVYSHPILYLETFVDPSRFRGLPRRGSPCARGAPRGLQS